MAFLTDIITALGPFWTIVILSFLISLGVSIAYKYLTNQERLKELKEKLKKLQEDSKKNRDNPGKMMSLQKEMMSINAEYMKSSFKPTLFTMLPIILIFGWFNGALSFEPIMPGKSVDVTITGVTGNVALQAPKDVQVLGNATLVENGFKYTILPALEGKYTLNFLAESKTYTKDILVSTKQEYIDPEQKYKEDKVLISVGQPKLTVFNLFGWNVSWLWAYVIFSLAFSLSIRKAMKLY